MKQSSPLRFLAIDLGAESGRAIVGHFDGQRLDLEEIHRFSNGGVRVGDSLHWDVLQIWSEIKGALAKAAAIYGDSLAGLGLDTWGVDFALLAADDSLLGNPYHYRDARTNGMLERAFQKVPRSEIYAQTGIQFMQINSLYQLLAMVESGSPLLATARTFLNTPDLFNFWLSGRKVSEYSIASTTQCFNPRTGDWAWSLLEDLAIPTGIFQPVLPAGSVLDQLRPSLMEECSAPPIPVIASASHDTASAVAAVPASSADYIYLSSGTWSLMGAEISEPLITPQSLAYNFTNEGGVNQTIRLLKNIMGMWLLQECRREWAREGESYSYQELTRMAEVSEPFGPLIDSNHTSFLAPGKMPARVQAFCQMTGQVAPEGKGAIVRCILESLALEYRAVAEKLDELLGRHLGVIHIIGGGSRNNLLNQMTADATRRDVIAGPVEATAMGNLLVQAIALGELTDLQEARAVVHRSCQPVTFAPRETGPWEAAYERYQKIKESLNENDHS